jgi:hypothetical protein
MRRLTSVSLVAGLLVGLTGAAPASQQPGDSAPEPTALDQASSLAAFNGLWIYNEEHSINIATGRPERAPRNAPATPRPAAPRRPVPAPGTMEGPPEQGSPFAPSPQMLRENRDMLRDLMEIAESLELAVTPESLSIIDDLRRERSYATDGRFARYRLGASEFRARVSIEGNRLRREIEGTFGFRMTETYFVSPEADRLFVILRVGSVARGRPPVGADRVYDRGDRELP